MTTTTDERPETTTERPAPLAQCGRMSSGLWRRGIDHDPCDREDGHPGLCVFLCTGPLP